MASNSNSVASVSGVRRPPSPQAATPASQPSGGALSRGMARPATTRLEDDSKIDSLIASVLVRTPVSRTPPTPLGCVAAVLLSVGHARAYHACGGAHSCRRQPELGWLDPAGVRVPRVRPGCE